MPQKHVQQSIILHIDACIAQYVVHTQRCEEHVVPGEANIAIVTKYKVCTWMVIV